MIKFKHVSKRYGENTVVDDINFEIEEGEFLLSSDLQVAERQRP